MKGGIHPAGPIRAVPRLVSEDSIWVSESLLADTFHRFASGHRRHGSHVPGPLEARRRSARRRNTYLAHRSSDIPPIEAGILSGQQKHQAWWKGLQGPTQKPVPSLLPTWLAPRPFQPPPAPHEQSILLDLLYGSIETNTSSEKRADKYRAALETVQNLEELRLLIRETCIDFVHDPQHSELAFKHILKARWGIETVVEFLIDPKLNPPGTENFKTLFLELHQESDITKASFKKIIKATCAAISLGLLSPDQIKVILETPAVNRFYLSSLNVSEDPAKWTLDLLSALKTSSVLKVTDLGEGFLRQWAIQLLHSRLLPSTAQLTWELRDFTGWSERELTSHITLRWLDQIIEAKKDQESPSLTFPIKFLERLPRHLLGQTFIDVTDRLVVLVKDGVKTPESLEIWLSILSKAKNSSVAAVAECIPVRCNTSMSRLNSRQRLLTLTWTAIGVCFGKPDFEGQLKRFQLQSDFVETFKPNGIGSTDALASILECLKELPMPEKLRMLYLLRHMTNDCFVVRRSSRTLESTLDALDSRNFGLLFDHVFYWHASSHFNDALTTYAESVNKDLKLFQRIAVALIGIDGRGFAVIRRILSHNLALKLSLTQSSYPRSQITPSEADGHKNSSIHLHDPEQILQLINNLATSLAISPALSPRGAVRRIFWCYWFLRRHHAPVQAPITRAFWHAGVTRYPNSPGGEKFRWILELVREVEGPDVVARLLWSDAFRRERERNILAFRLPAEEIRVENSNVVRKQSSGRHDHNSREAPESGTNGKP